MRIVKCRFGGRAHFETITGFVYCGRNFGGFTESPLHNPFKSGRDGELAEVLAKYRATLHRYIIDGYQPIVEALGKIHETSVLGCWCLDKEFAGSGLESCHCDVIAKAWRWMKRQQIIT